MRDPGSPTFDQLRVLLAISEAGSLTAAARRLGRAPSVISYAIDNLESELGVALFDRNSTRKPVLTKSGVAIIAEARAVADCMDRLKAKVKGILEGLEPEVSIAVDLMLPTDHLVDVLRSFQVEFPTVCLRLHVEALGAVTQMVVEGKAVIGINNVVHGDSEGLERIPIAGVHMIPVAAPTHPLAQGSRRKDARDHIQLVLTDRSLLTAGRDFAVISNKTWRLGDLGAKHALLIAGVGWGNMPENMVRDDVDAGRLVRLKLQDCDGGIYPLQIIYRTAFPPGPAARWLVDRFIGQTSVIEQKAPRAGGSANRQS